MDVRLKERLIGALVVVGLAVVVLPWILDDEKGDSEFASRIPPAPPAPAARAVELSQPRPLDEAGFDDTIIAAETSDTSTAAIIEAPAKTGSAGSGQAATGSEAQVASTSPSVSPAVKVHEPERPVPVAVGFVIQLGSFGNRDNAERLVQTLRKNGFTAYSRFDSRASPPMVRVLVGPIPKREAADKQLPRLKSLSGQTGIVVPYDPLKH